MTDLLLRRVTEPRAGAEEQDDYDVIGDVSGGHGLSSAEFSEPPWHLQQRPGCGGLSTRNARTAASSARAKPRCKLSPRVGRVGVEAEASPQSSPSPPSCAGGVGGEARRRGDFLATFPR